MLVNEKTAIVGRDVILVPYRREHVLTYHTWMLSPELRELTASEELTLDEEYEMQEKWRTDNDKLTFIILARTWDAHPKVIANELLPSRAEILACPMIGDVNLFVKENLEGEEPEVEAEVMIAEPAYRRKGLASSALQLLFRYATSPDGPPSLRIAPTRLVVQIGETNKASLQLFEKLGFVISKQVSVFNEVQLRYAGNGSWTGGVAVEFN